MRELRIRRRRSAYAEPPDEEEFYCEPDEETQRRNNDLTTIFLYIFGIFALYFFLFNAANTYKNWLPTPNSNYNSHRFVAERAMTHLVDLQSIGPKVTGSYENEVLAFNMIVEKIKFIKAHSKRHRVIELSTQLVNGTLPLNFQGCDFLITYNHIQNVIAKIGQTNKSVLINCHYDSVPTSPGASDDILNCAVMLEVLEVMSKSDILFPFSVIFLFNGAEENPLLGSHGFITKHKWANEVKAFINLESCGAGGREVLFQSGPNNPWLLEKYSRVPHPHGMVIAEEVFQSGIIPSDTDFRIFRDHGGLSGLDFAHCGNGFVYHTKYDNIESIPNVLGVLQHTGDNILNLVQTIASSEEINITTDLIGKTVYFDFFGIYFVHSSQWFFTFVSICVSVVSIIAIFRTKVSVQMKLTDAFHGISFCFGSLVMAVIVNTSIAYFVDYMNLSLSWYSCPLLLVPMYIIPAFICFTSAAALTDINFQHKYSSWDRICNYCLSTQLFFTFILVLTCLKIRSSYVLVILILLPTITSIILKITTQNKVIWVFSYLISTLPGTLYIVYLGIMVLNLFIPITGRSRGTRNPETLIGFLCTILSFGAYCYLAPLILLIHKKMKLITSSTIITIVTTAMLVSLMSPFTIHNPQRVSVTHVDREYYDASGVLKSTDSFYWTEHWERRGQTVLPFLANLPVIEKFCKEDMFCGVPWMTAFLFKTNLMSTYKPASSPHGLHGLAIKLIENYKLGNMKRISYNISGGPDHMSIFIALDKNLTLTKWSVDKETPEVSHELINSSIYMIYYVHGLETDHWIFSMEIEDKKNVSAMSEIAFIGRYMHHSNLFTRDFSKFLRKFPDTSHLYSTIAIYKHLLF